MSDFIESGLGAISIFILSPFGILTAVAGQYDLAAFCMATAAFFTALSNHDV